MRWRAADHAQQPRRHGGLLGRAGGVGRHDPWRERDHTFAVFGTAFTRRTRPRERALERDTLVARDARREERSRSRSRESVFVVTSSTRVAFARLPTRVASHSFLDTMRVFAQSEIEMGAIFSVPQQVEALRSICHCIVDNTEGVNVWASWALLVHMLSDPRLRRMVQASAVSDLEAATVVCLPEARAEITRRARMDVAAQQQQQQQAAKQAKRAKESAAAAVAKAVGATMAAGGNEEEDDDDDDDDDEERAGNEFDLVDCDDVASVALGSEAGTMTSRTPPRR